MRLGHSQCCIQTPPRNRQAPHSTWLPVTCHSCGCGGTDLVRLPWTIWKRHARMWFWALGGQRAAPWLDLHGWWPTSRGRSRPPDDLQPTHLALRRCSILCGPWTQKETLGMNDSLRYTQLEQNGDLSQNDAQIDRVMRFETGSDGASSKQNRIW